MSLLIVVIHIIVCLALIMIVLLQTGKGADMGAAFGGGGSNTLFGATGASTFLSKMTTVAAVVFMLTSLVLAYMAAKPKDAIDFNVNQPAVTEPAPATDSTAPQPQTEAPASPETAPAANQEEEPDK